ncbi:glycosyltransferase [Candidatus Woesearchaeota archaeon]|nr:glycosyltransferase [Candidatus Woesearchaeota archaeon]
MKKQHPNMKIGMFTNTYRPVLTGVVVSVDSFKRGLEALDQEVHIFAPHYYTAEKKRKEEKIHRYKSIDISIDSEFNPIKSLTFPVLSNRIPGIIKKLDLDIIHSHHPWIIGNAAKYFAKKYNIPLVFTYHTQYEKYAHYLPFDQDITSIIAKKLSLHYCSKCDCVIAPTESIKKYLLKNKVKTRIEIIPTGIDIKKFQGLEKNKIRKKYNVKEDENLLLYVGRIGLEKNIFFLLKSFKKMIKSLPDTKLLIAGCGPEEEKVKEFIEKNSLKKNVMLAGSVPHKDIPSYYAAADLFVFASKTETQGIIFLEAKAAGLPTIAVKAPGSVDTIVHNKDGILVPESIDRFSKEAVKLLDDKDLMRKMSENAEKNVKPHSIENTSKKLLSVYRSLR